MTKLIVLCEPLFYLIQEIKQESVFINDGFRKKVIMVCDAFKSAAKEAGYPCEIISQALYALVALFDELILRFEQSSALLWSTNSLQLHYFGSNTAGQHFFDRLSRLLSDHSVKKELLSVYGFCLSMGFRGKYQLSELAALKNLQSKVIRKIGSDVVPIIKKPKSHKNSVSVWLVVIVLAIITVIILISFTIAIDEKGVIVKTGISTKIENLHDQK